MSSLCGHKEAICIIGNFWECITCDAPKQTAGITKPEEVHTNYGCERWGWNCGSPACEHPHKFKIGDRVRYTFDNPKKLIIGTVIRYHKHTSLSNQKCQSVQWDNGSHGNMLDHNIEHYKDPAST